MPHHHNMKFNSHQLLVIINFVMLVTVVVLCVLLVKNKCYRNSNSESFRSSLVGDTDGVKYTYLMSTISNGQQYLDIIKETPGSDPVTYNYVRGELNNWSPGSNTTTLSPHTN